MPPSRTLVRAVAAERNLGRLNPNFLTRNAINFNGYDLSYRENETILCFDSGGEDENRLLLFSCTELIQFAQRCRSFAGDGTFSLAPKCYNNGTTNRTGQLYTLHAIYGGIQVPVVYALMARRTQAEYERLFVKIQDIIDGINIERFMMDMEKAARNAIVEIFQNPEISYCYYHFQVIFHNKI